MKFLVPILALLLAAPAPAEAARCFLIFCAPVTHHRHHVKHHRRQPTPQPAPQAVQQPAPAAEAPQGGVDSCGAILLAYAGRKGDRDEFVRTFPVPTQRHILECIGDRDE